MPDAGQLLVITPTLGRSPWLAGTVSDVEALASTIPLTHVLVAPADQTGELRARFPGASVFAEPSRGGVYGAVNAGAAAFAGWRWLTWINDDDRLLPGFGEIWRRAQETPSAADVWYGDVDYIDDGGRTVAGMPLCRRPGDVPALLAAGISPFSQHGSLIAAGLWRRLGGIDASLRIMGDFDFWVRASAAGARFSFVPEKVAAFRVHAGQLSGAVAQAREELEAVLRRGGLKAGRTQRWPALARFRAANLPRILQRARHTGRLRSRDMFAR